MKTILDLRVDSWRRNGRTILKDIRLRIEEGEHWAILGPNGAGKSSLLAILAAYEWPSEGEVKVLGETYGRCDMNAMKRRIGVVNAAIARWLRPNAVAEEIVASGRYAVLGPWRTYTDEDREIGRRALERLHASSLAGSAFGTLSQGERQRVLIARALVNDPDLLILDEAAISLDPLARERLLHDIEALHRAGGPTTIVVTHHVEELPSTLTHALLIKDGQSLAQGPIAETLTSENLSALFGAEAKLSEDGGRYQLSLKLPRSS